MAHMSDIREEETQEDIEAFVRVFKVLVEEEKDGDHVQVLFHRYGDMMKWWATSDRDIVWPDGDEPDAEDVETALRIAHKYFDESMATFISVEVGVSLPEIEKKELLHL